MLCLFEGITIGTQKSEKDSMVPLSSFSSLFILQVISYFPIYYHFKFYFFFCDFLSYVIVY
ncbi:unnamed protein product [Brassica oleracea]